jgi:hypothetical protein
MPHSIRATILASAISISCQPESSKLQLSRPPRTTGLAISMRADSQPSQPADFPSGREQWSFSDLLDDSTATNLTNGGRLPVYFLMDCLNGFFQDVYTESLAESLLPAPHGGAVGVWAPSGLTNAPLRRSSINPCFGRSLETRAGPWAPRCWRRNCWSPIPTFVAPGSCSAPPVGCQILNLTFSVVIVSVVVQGLSIKLSFESWTSQATGSAIYYRRSAAPTRSMSDGGRCLR